MMTGQVKPRSWFVLFLADRGWISIFLACLTILFTVLAVKNEMQARTVAQDGFLTHTLVLDRRTENTDTGPEYYVTYVAVMDGENVRIETRVSPTVYRETADPFHQVRYLSKDPKMIADEVDLLQGNGRKFTRFALLAGLSGLFLGWFFGRDAMNALLARKVGIEEDAYIYARNENHAAKSSSTVHIKFRSHSGAEGRSFSHALSTFPNLDRGDMIRVFTRNGRSWWVQDTGPRPEMPKHLPKVQRSRDRSAGNQKRRNRG